MQKLEIKNPCSQKWEDMEPMAQGRYCSSCNHLIRDFSEMDNEQLVAMLQSGIYSCGMFSSQQMGTVYQVQTNKPQQKKYWAAIAASLVAGVFQISMGYSQTTNYTKPLNRTYTKIRVDQEPVLPNGAETVEQKEKLSFRIVDAETKQPLPGVEIKMHGHSFITDSLGRVDIEFNYQADTLVSFQAHVFLSTHEPEKIKLNLQACYKKLTVIYMRKKKKQTKQNEYKIVGEWG